MPNQRDPDKRLLATWLNKEELKRYKQLAREAGISLSDYVKNALEKFDTTPPRPARAKRR